MDLVELVVLLCSLAHPGVCTEKHMVFQSHGSLEQCMKEAPPYLAQWINEHPGVRVARFHCAWPGSEDEKS